MAKKGLLKNKTSLRQAAKTTSNRLHVVPTINGWSVKREGSVKSYRVFRTKQEALSGASSIKKKASIVIHKKDGTIERWTHNS